MSATIKTVCVTGCLGFMGSHFTRACLKRKWRVWGLDKRTYAARDQWLEEFREDPGFAFHQTDIATLDHLYEVDLVVNFAARRISNSYSLC